MKGVIHWASAVHNHPAEFRLYDRLFTVPNPGAAEEIESVLNPTSLVVKHGFVEQSLANARTRKGYQFEREGYFCADNKDSRPEHLVFNLTVSLKKASNSKQQSAVKNHVNFDRTFYWFHYAI